MFNFLRVLIFSFLLILPIGADAAWFTGVIDGIDVWTVDIAPSNHETASSACMALESGAFLPNKSMLADMYVNRASLGTFLNVNYWTSSSYDVDNAYRIDFLNGSSDYGLKTTTEDVRCVRSTPYNYDSAEVTAVSTELSAMLTAYLPAILLIFATIFALFFFRKQIQIWLNR